jgi:hypothetical protein
MDSSNAAGDVAGLCEGYKRSTRAFLGWLTRALPQNKKLKQSLLKDVSVAEVWQAAKLVAASAQPVPKHVLSDLDTSIRVRKEVASLYTRASSRDPKHLHFIEVLVKARELLNPVAPAPSPDGEPAPPDSPASLPNSFSGLAVEEMDALTEMLELQPPLTPSLTGAVVRVDGLTSTPELNGNIRYAAEYLQEMGMYKVRNAEDPASFWPPPHLLHINTVPPTRNAGEKSPCPSWYL